MKVRQIVITFSAEDYPSALEDCALGEGAYQRGISPLPLERAEIIRLRPEQGLEGIENAFWANYAPGYTFILGLFGEEETLSEILAQFRESETSLRLPLYKRGNEERPWVFFE